MAKRANRTRIDYETHVATLRRFYGGERTVVFTGDEPTAHELDPRTFFLEAINDHASTVQASLREDVFPVLAHSLQNRDVMGLTWDELTDPCFTALRASLEAWASKWGLEPWRWSREPLWMMDAALRLLLKWHEGQSTSDFTLTSRICEWNEPQARQVDELRKIGGFPLLVYAHVLEQQPWLTKASANEMTSDVMQWVGDRSAQDIAKSIRRTTTLIDLKHRRKATPGR